MSACGLLFCRREAWLRFNDDFTGFGGEEGYLQRKYQKHGYKNVCLPYLRWTHRFGRPNGVPYDLSNVDKARNYAIGLDELGIDLTDAKNHFVDETSSVSEDEWNSMVQENKRVEVKQERPFITCLCPTYKRPEFVANAIACFERQDYPKDRCKLVVFDDSGELPNQAGPNWEIYSQQDRFDSLWVKYNKMIEMNPNTHIYAMWDDDDIYLPWHLSSLAHNFQLGKRQMLKPEYVFTNNPTQFGDVVKERASDVYHGAYGYSWSMMQAGKGFDEEFGLKTLESNIAKFSSLAETDGFVSNRVLPSYVYRMVRGGNHLLDVQDEQQYEDTWDYYGFMPPVPVCHLIPKLDQETSLIYRKFSQRG